MLKILRLGGIKEFLKLEAASGVILMGMALLAMIVSNSEFSSYYESWLAPLHLPINDGLMVVFFLLIGLEIKHECVEGALSSRKTALLPVIAACGGVIVPALIYAWYNWGTANLRGWAVPCATDIAFALGVVALFGDRLNSSLKIFLMALAVIDDLIAVLIIAIFYTESLYFPAFGVAAACLAGLYALARSEVNRALPYILLGIILWAAVLMSGVHATVAGVLLGVMIPVKVGKNMVNALHPWVAFGVMPIFAFANAGVPLEGVRMEQLLSPLPLGIILGLFVGKQVGIFSFSWLAVKLRLASLPEGASWFQLYAISAVAGIGFTMSLFIGGLAFHDPLLMTETRLGVLTGSLMSALFGAAMLSWSIRPALSKP